MRALLDSHAFIWWVLDTPDLSGDCRAILEDGGNEVFLSVASAYEIVYKAAQGRLTLPDEPTAYIQTRLIENGFQPMPIHLSHALRAAALPPIHGDPIDRILIAQAQIEGLALLTADAAIARYDVETIW
jgi:PIN domain nuclease of toxin-antitoxin system